MRIEQLIYLKKIAETGSINLASKNLFITQQALSTAIINLEKELGASLLTRSKAGVQLTSDGQFVVTEGEKIIATAENIRNHFIKTPSLSKTLSISSTPVAQHYLLNKPVSYFYKNFPAVTIVVAVKTTSEVTDDVITGTSDIGFLSELNINGHSELILPDGIKYIPIFSYAMDIIVSIASPLAQCKKISLEQLEKETFILLHNLNAKEDILYKVFPPDHLPPIFIAETEQLFFQMIRDNLGCAFFNPIANFLIPQTLDPGVTTRPVDQDFHITFGYLVNEQTYHDDLFIQIFCDHIR